MNVSRMLMTAVASLLVLCVLTACSTSGQTNWCSATSYESLTMNKNVTFDSNPTYCGVLKFSAEDGSVQLMYGAFFDDLDSHKLALVEGGYAAIDYESAVKLFDRCPEWSESLDVQQPVQASFFYVGPHPLA